MKSDKELELICQAEAAGDLLEKNGVGGIVLAVSRGYAAWHVVIPKWVGMTSDGDAFRIKFGKSDPDPEKGTNTLHFIGTLRDMAYDIHSMYGRLFRVVKLEVEKSGGEIDHKPFGGGKERIDPFAGKGS